MSEPDKKHNIPAYAPYKAFLRFIRQMGEHGLPSHIDRSVLSSMSGSQQSSILGCLQYLGLIIADGEPTPAFKALVSASSAEFGGVLREIVVNSYPFIFKNGLDLKTTTTKKVEEKFREQGVSGSTVSKCIAFFLACCKDAGIEVSRFVKTPPVVTAARTVRRNASGRMVATVEDQEEDNSEPQQPTLLEVHPAIVGLLRDLPPSGQTWPKVGRDKFLAAFTAVLSFVYPEDES